MQCCTTLGNYLKKFWPLTPYVSKLQSNHVAQLCMKKRRTHAKGTYLIKTCLCTSSANILSAFLKTTAYRTESVTSTAQLITNFPIAQRNENYFLTWKYRIYLIKIIMYAETKVVTVSFSIWMILSGLIFQPLNHNQGQCCKIHQPIKQDTSSKSACKKLFFYLYEEKEIMSGSFI